jgi:hypothetical protein
MIEQATIPIEKVMGQLSKAEKSAFRIALISEEMDMVSDSHQSIGQPTQN